MAGFTGGLVAASCLEPWRPNDFVTIAPAFILAFIGSILGSAQRNEASRLPFLAWMAGLRQRAVLLRSPAQLSVGIRILVLIGVTLIIHERCTAPRIPLEINSKVMKK